MSRYVNYYQCDFSFINITAIVRRSHSELQNISYVVVFFTSGFFDSSR